MERVKKPKARRMRLSSVANSIRLTKAFSENEYEMGISALATRLGLAKSTVHRLATTLVEYDILEQNRETGKYRLGLALFELGTLVRRKMDTASESRQQMLSDPDKRAAALSRIPSGRFATPEEIAAAVVYLASPGAASVTGHTLPVDGGFLAQ